MFYVVGVIYRSSHNNFVTAGTQYQRDYDLERLLIKCFMMRVRDNCCLPERFIVLKVMAPLDASRSSLVKRKVSNAFGALGIRILVRIIDL